MDNQIIFQLFHYVLINLKTFQAKAVDPNVVPVIWSYAIRSLWASHFTQSTLNHKTN